MSRKILGLDIRSASVTAVLIETGLKKNALSGFMHAPFSGEGEYYERLSSALDTISRGLDLKDCTCVLSVPSNRFFYRNIAVPFSETKKIQQMLPYELESAIPFPVEDLLIEFQKLSLKGPEGETRIIAVGIEIARLASFIGVVEACGITPNILVPGGYSMAAWIARRAQPDECLLLADYDDEDCTLYLILSNKISFIRSFPLPTPEANDSLKLWEQIRRSIAGFESLSEVKATPDNILLNGFAEETCPGKLQAEASTPVRIVDVMPPVGTEGVDGLNNLLPRSCYNAALSSSLMVLEGLKGVNFRKGPLAARTRLWEYRDGLKKTGILAGVVMLLWLLFMLTENHMAQNRVELLDEQIAAVFKQTFPGKTLIKNAALDQMKSEIKIVKKAAFASGDTGAQLRSVDMLNKIHQGIPKETDVHFSKLVSGEDGILITGTAASFNTVDDVKTRLEKTDGFISVKIPSDMDRDGDRVRFKLKIQTSVEGSS